MLTENRYWGLMLALYCGMTLHIPAVAFFEFGEGVNNPDNVPVLLMISFAVVVALIAILLARIDRIVGNVPSFD